MRIGFQQIATAPHPPRQNFPARGNPAARYDALGDVLDLSKPGRAFQDYTALAPEDQEAFLQMLASLLHQGVVGTETVDLNGRPQDRFLGPGLASHAPLVRRLDLRA